MTLRHISFDLDGTLINSFANMKTAWEAATAELHINCGFAEYRRYVGLPFPRILEMLDLSNYESELSDLYFRHTRQLADQIPVIEGAPELLERCRARGLSTSIVTSKPRRNSELIVERFGFHVDRLICGDDLKRGKPDPAAAQLLCEELGLAPADILYVGDAIFDFQFALNAGAHFLFFTDQGANRMPTNMLNPVRSVDTLGEVDAAIAR